MVACTDDIITENPDVNDGKGIGEMVLFTAGKTNSNLTTRADDDNNTGDNYSETPGQTYYMPATYRFVCRMYYKAASGSNAKFDLSENTKTIAWFKVDGNVGNSLYWRNNYPILDSNVESNFDVFGNDANATFFYWQNRKEHAFLAWTDLNKAGTTNFKYGTKIGDLKLEPADMTYEEHTNQKQVQNVLAGFKIAGVEKEFEYIDDDFVQYIKAHYTTISNSAEQTSATAAVSGAQGYDPNKIHSYMAPVNCVRYSYYSGERHDMKYEAGKEEIEDNLLSYYRGPLLLWVWGDGQEQEYTPQSGDVEDTNPDAEGKLWLRDSRGNKVALMVKVYEGVTAETPGVQSENVQVSDPTEEDPNHTKTGTRYYIKKYLATFASGKFHYDFTQNPRYTVAIDKYYERKETEVINEYKANKFDLTRGTKTSINEQPDPCLALTIKAPTGVTQASNRVNLYFKHQFSQVQVNLKGASDNSVTLSAEDITKVELLGVSEEGYVFTELDEDGKVHAAAYKDVLISEYGEDELAQNEYGTALSLFDMKNNSLGEADNWGYPVGYLKSFNGITFGLLKAIRITWKEHDTQIEHEATMKVTDQRLSTLKSGYKYIWNVELRRGTLATLRVDIVDWIVPNSELKYETSGTIDETEDVQNNN